MGSQLVPASGGFQKKKQGFNTIFCPNSYHYIDNIVPTPTLITLQQALFPSKSHDEIMEHLQNTDMIQLLIAKDNATKFSVENGRIQTHDQSNKSRQEGSSTVYELSLQLKNVRALKLYHNKQ